MRKFITKNYWKSSFSNFYNVKSICLMGIFIALMTVIGGYLSLNPFKLFGRTVNLLFIFWPLLGILFGPIPSVLIAMIVDILMYFLFPTGYPFDIRYTLSEALIAFIASLFFYKSNVSILKIIICEGIKDIGVHVGIESWFMKTIMNYNMDAFKTYLVGGLTKNLIMWPIEVIVLVVLIASMIPAFKALKLVDECMDSRVRIISKKYIEEGKKNEEFES